MYGAGFGSLIGTLGGAIIGTFYYPSLGTGPAAFMAGFGGTITGGFIGFMLGPSIWC